MNQIPASALGIHLLRRLEATDSTNHEPTRVAVDPVSA
jgi:hypothetical protein